MCSRIIYETGNQEFIVGRGMDWNDPTAQTSLWIYPRGMKKDGGVGENPIHWTSKYGSIATSFYNAGAADGMNEAGLTANILYLAESNYGDVATSTKPTLSVGAWGQYFLDNFATVEEAVEAMQDVPFIISAPMLPNGRGATVHLSISDRSGDSAILEFLDGELVINHSREYRVMTNSPIYSEQIAIDKYWKLIGGSKMLPGTINAADRFVRLSYALESSPKYTDHDMATASVMSQMRAIGVPLGMEDPDRPNISATLWRTISDNQTNRYYFESALKPSIFWVDLDKVDFSENAEVKALDCDTDAIYAGEVSKHFTKATPLPFIK
ncbi:linear amide C-N hydrolase [Flammeovirga yaeyamensis]|uniref:Linear amide C-N hydrolase n=1 Tax=Flammeovirga yaeyamensis TaxID=367791 RepID=A0AAX1N1S4_9BACT|nr:linear amide C-N hydrolase [Flammeovirga yaeyamensis]MBB3698198.1 choloylglycine hydrolase [Flammeovirga yaeyamensis]NMF34447.1 linear amide C-N hydrolase [Flammeovirga yaeyamensis]QWG01426.1 linear amide C-N hydrolase [Flammeovirga yaeyamensis]